MVHTFHVYQRWDLKDQFKGSIYYPITLEQRWEQIYKCQNRNYNFVVNVDVTVDAENVFVAGQKTV